MPLIVVNIHLVKGIFTGEKIYRVRFLPPNIID